MGIKFKSALAAVAVAATAFVAVAPANAQWHRHYHHGWYGPGAGFFAGAVLGSALARPYYGYGPGYYAAPPAYADADGYCAARFKSYDPGSGTYLGYDGARHPCP